MSGLKSGSGDDLWDEDDEADDGATAEGETEADADPETDETAGQGTPPRDRSEGRGSAPDRASRTDATETGPETGSDAAPPGTKRDAVGEGSGRADDDVRPYIVRRAIQDKSVQFERDERLTFFVHRDVVDGERELVNDLESALGRDVPKFDVREAVYRAALRNREDVLEELLDMGYALDEGD